MTPAMPVKRKRASFLPHSAFFKCMGTQPTMPRDSLKRILEKTIHTKVRILQDISQVPNFVQQFLFFFALLVIDDFAFLHRRAFRAVGAQLPSLTALGDFRGQIGVGQLLQEVWKLQLHQDTFPHWKSWELCLWPLSPMVFSKSKMFIFLLYMLHICYVTFTSTHLTRMCICICVCASCFFGIFMYHIYTESKSKSKVWENDCAEFLQWQLPQKLQASFRQQWHLRKWLERPGVAGNFPCAQLPTMHKQHLVIFFPSFPLEIRCIQRARTETLWPRGFQRTKKHNIKHHVFKEISPLHFSSSRPPVGSIDTATSALPTQRSAASVAHCYAARLPTSATVPRYFSLKRHRLLAQASCHLWPTHNDNGGANRPNRWKSTSYKGSQQLEGLMLLLEPHLHAWREEPTPGHPPRSSPSPAREKSSQQTRNHVSACNADGNSNPEIWKKKKLWNSPPGRFRWNQSKHFTLPKNTPMKTVSKVIFPSRLFSGTPKTSSLHTCKLSVVGADASGLDIPNTSLLSDLEWSLFLLPLVQWVFSRILSENEMG